MKRFGLAMVSACALLLGLSSTALANGTVSCSQGTQSLTVVAGSTTTFPVNCTPANLDHNGVSYSQTGSINTVSFATTPNSGTGTGTYTASYTSAGKTDAFTVIASVTGASQATASYTVVVTITQPAAPSCNTPDAAATRIGKPVTVVFSCSGAGLAWTSATSPKHGRLSAGSGSGVTYTPAARYSGTDHFVVTLHDVYNRTVEDRVDMTVGRIANPNDQLGFQVAESSFSLPAQTSKTFQLSCPAGDVATDGHALVQAVDQGMGTPADVLVDEARTVSANTYEFTLDNPLLGQAQGQLYANCVAPKTAKGHSLDLTPATQAGWSSTASSNGGTLWTTTVSCTGGAVVAPGYLATDSSGAPAAVALIKSEPGNDGSSWTFEFNQPNASTTITVSAQCLSATTKDGSLLNEYFTPKHATVTANDTPAGTDIRCPAGSVSILAGYSVPSGVAFLGTTPRAQKESVWFEGLSEANGGTATASLLCLGLTTSVSQASSGTTVWQY